MNYLILIILVSVITGIKAWDNDDLEIFDLVEEVNRNFYEVLNVSKDADTNSIKKAFRQLSLQLHPDKNSAPDADVQFRQLVGVYDVLKDLKKREKYDLVLINGLPNWKSAVYYYRHVRKMGLMEMSIILFIVITIGQYTIGWAAYIEKKFNLEEQNKVKMKKMQKKLKSNKANNEILDDMLSELEKPSIKNTLPFQIPIFVWTFFINIPSNIKLVLNYLEEEKRRKQYEHEEKLRQEKELEEIKKRELEPKPVKRRKPAFVLQERNYDEPSCLLDPLDEPRNEENIEPPIISGGFWSDDDLTELVRLIKKYPQGIAERWEKIANVMRRPVSEITHMAAKLKENCYKLPTEQEEPSYVEPPKKIKTKGGKYSINCQPTESNVDSFENEWTQAQQKALENALTKYPKGSVADRWEKIAHCVSGKTKEECIQRFKFLVELVKKQKSNKTTDTSEVEENQSQELSPIS